MFRRQTESEILDCLSDMERPTDIAHRILLNGIKPAFAANPHPQVDSNTGRKLAVTAGGERARHEMFEDQRWKTPASWGISNVLHGCLIRMSVGYMWRIATPWRTLTKICTNSLPRLRTIWL